MDFAHDARTEDLCGRLRDFMTTHVYPAEPVLAEQAGTTTGGRWEQPPVIAELQAEARRRGLWNLFLPEESQAEDMTCLRYAPLAEIMGHSPALAPRALNCAAPDTGNMELLARFGTPAQQERWLRPLLAAEIGSAFCMTEPEVASSDARNLATRIVRDGDTYLLNGHKWWSTGALSPGCRLLIVLGRTDSDAEPHRQQSMVLVPRDTPGVVVGRGLTVFGYDDAAEGGHAEIEFSDVRVPADHLLGGEGDGFAMAQARLGPGRVHHCMRLVGMAERALRLLCTRVSERTAFGRPLADQGVIRQWIAESRIRIDQARLLILRTAWLLDGVGARQAHTDVAAIKLVTPAMAEWVLDKAIQAHGAAGLSADLPLAAFWSAARALRFADGPDEVHERSVARAELGKYR